MGSLTRQPGLRDHLQRAVMCASSVPRAPVTTTSPLIGQASWSSWGFLASFSGACTCVVAGADMNGPELAQWEKFGSCAPVATPRNRSLRALTRMLTSITNKGNEATNTRCGPSTRAHGMEEVRGSNPLSSTAGQRPVSSLGNRPLA